MSGEGDLYYFCTPTGGLTVSPKVTFLPVQEFLADEPACKSLWDLLVSQFKTRSKFLAIWPSVRYVCFHRNPEGMPDGFLLVTTPVNWQIDYVVVHPDARGQGIAGALVKETLNQAHQHHAPYVMLTSRAGLRPMYESFGFTVVPCSTQNRSK